MFKYQHKAHLTTLLVLILRTSLLFPQQIDIPRIEEMPNFPQPYIMRDWKQVALGYDSLVYKLTGEGAYLPLTSLYTNTRNYPDHGSFYQQTYVGQSLTHNEAINSMMSVIGASLSGIDKSNQEGLNWVQMTEEFFNRENGQNVYLNNAGTKTGNDWWYETIPNVLFYQLYSLYPETGHFSEQFLQVADRWLEAVWGMGGSIAPWTIPYMNYRSYDLESMEPNTNGVPEPEASGALAWIFYQAYTQTGIEKYRIGAELCMEFFSKGEDNPSYEIQYLYGALLSARMNGELGTSYDIEKIINWCFDIGPLRVWAHTKGWGITVGNWNGIDVCGLNGAISLPDNTDFGDYAFLMNSFQQAGILTPLVRYDDRFARAIGKYLLNMANSARLFYPNFLPADNQDGAEWSVLNDPNSYIAYEAIRRYKDGKSPYATGDAVEGGWAPTNHSLYSSAAVGYLGAILETTNVEGILKFDLLKTDFFHQEAYPSYLIYNPFPSEKTIEIDVGSELIDIYDATTNSLYTESATGLTPVSIKADEAAVLILIPAGSAYSQVQNKIICNGITIDYIPKLPVPKPLRMKSLSPRDSVITKYDVGTTIYCTIDAAIPEEYTFSWTEKGEQIGSNSDSINWLSPKNVGEYWIKCEVSSLQNEHIEDSVLIKVVDFINTNPVIESIFQDPARVNPGDTAHIICLASDTEDADLIYNWSSDHGSFSTNQNASTRWTAPSIEGEYTIYCDVIDTYHGSTRDSITIRVIDQSGYLAEDLLAHYPFNSDADDYSGNNNHGIIHDVSYIKVRDGAYNFNGYSSFIEVPSSENLNCNDAISVVFWMKATEQYDRETYPVSHGLWHNRWKVSVTENKIRWTIRTNDNGEIIISDLDSKTNIEMDRLYQVAATYDGKYSELYINSNFEGFQHQEGIIENTDMALTIGQASPSSAANNFKGALDEIRIYNYALSHEDIKAAYNQDLIDYTEQKKSSEILMNVYPNPFQENIIINYKIDSNTDVSIEIYDVMSSKVLILFEGRQTAGSYTYTWNGSSSSGKKLPKGMYICLIRTQHSAQSKKLIYK